MTMLITVEMPHEPFNTLVRNGSAGKIIRQILDTIKPEIAYFTEQDGARGGAARNASAKARAISDMLRRWVGILFVLC